MKKKTKSRRKNRQKGGKIKLPITKTQASMLAAVVAVPLTLYHMSEQGKKHGFYKRY